MASRERYRVLGVLMLAFFSTMAARLVISPMVPDLIRTFAVSKTAIGAALTGLWAAYAAFQFPAGVLADRYGERSVVLVGLGGVAAGSLALAGAPTFPAFAAGAVLVGVGSGLYFPAAVGVLDARFENTGQAMGLHLSGGDLAGVLAPVAAVAVAARAGWRPALAIGAVIAAPAIVAARWGIDPPGRTADAPRGRLSREVRTLFAGLRRPRVAYTVGLATLLGFTFQSVISFYPTFLVEYWGVTTARAGTVFAAVFLIWIVFLPVTGRIADTVHRDAVLGAVIVVLAAGMTTVVLAGSLEVVYLGTGLVGLGMSWGGVLAARLLAAFPDEDRTAGYGAARATYVFLGAGGNVITGWLAETAGWPTAYGAVAGLLGVAVTALVANEVLGLGL